MIEVGKTVLISMSRVLESIYSNHRPQGAREAFFAYKKEEGAVVFRGSASSYMLYKDYDDYSGSGGYEYPSKRKMWLQITEVIKIDDPASGFPGGTVRGLPTSLPVNASDSLLHAA
jgi:hypothetical protein